jgi:outer membrane protein assembly factor BamB
MAVFSKLKKKVKINVSFKEVIMKKNAFIVLLFTVVLLQTLGCKDPITPIYSDPFNQKSSLKFVWVKPIYQDSSLISQSQLYFVDDYVAMGTFGPLPIGQPKGIVFFNRITGDKHPSWTRYPSTIIEGNELYIRDFAIGGRNNDIAFFSELSNLYAYDVPSGQKKWKFNFPVYMPNSQFTTFDNQVYLTYWEGGTWSTTWAKLARYDAQTGTQEDLFTVSAVPEYDFFISPPVGYVAPNNDTLVIGVTYHYRFADHNKMAWLYCYNVTDKTMQWENKTFSNDNEESRNDYQIIDNGKVLIQTMRAVYCIDIETGNVVWKKEGLTLSLNKTHLLYEDGKIYCRIDEGNIYCWDAETGIEIWKNENLYLYAVDKDNIVLYHDRLYFTAFWYGQPHLICISAETGKLLWQDPGSFGALGGLLLLDKNLGYLYGVCDGFIYCLDINKTEMFMSSH